MTMPAAGENNPAQGIFFVVLGMSCISLNDALVKSLSGDYALHQLVFVRSIIGLCLAGALVAMGDGFASLKTRAPGLHLLRGLLIVLANLTFFTALSVMPLPTATAIFFVAPLMITALSVLLLGERVGIRRLGAVTAGFLGVLVMVRPGSSVTAALAHPLTALLPVAAALCYALMQILTRRLATTATAMAMAIYIQLVFLAVSAVFGLLAGDGRYAAGVEAESLQFLLRAWRWPDSADWGAFLALGALSGTAAYALSRAYQATHAATAAPFEYVAVPLSILWGWLFWRHSPEAETWIGVGLILGAGLYVFFRERAKQEPPRAIG